jgi:hypothetical protein
MELNCDSPFLGEEEIVSTKRQRYGPPHALCPSWARSIQGTEHISLLLWIGKDWCWSQLGWTAPAFFFASCALVWILYMTIAALFSWRLYSEVYKGVILLMWLLGLYAWMVGEFWTLWYSAGATQHALIYEQRGNKIAKWVLLSAVVLECIYYAVLVPLDVFAKDREARSLQILQAQSPSYPGVRYFKEFRIYASVHFFTWILKDCMWAWELPVPYYIMFTCTVLLNLDLLWRLSGHRREMYVEFVNYIVILMWVIANGFWAFGELVANTDATEDQFRRYTWPQWQVIHGTSFEFRYCAGWMFFFSGVFVVYFYILWIAATVRGQLISYEEYTKQQEILYPLC